MDYVALGKRVRAQRKLSRLTQDQLSEAAGISLSFLGHIERGTRKASIETLVAIANALKISTDLLLQDSLDEDLVGGFSSELSPDKQTLLREIANVIRDYSTDD